MQGGQTDSAPHQKSKTSLIIHDSMSSIVQYFAYCRKDGIVL